MTLLVPFDGSPLSKAALVRAAQFETVLEEGVVAVSVIPSGNARYARERGWLAEGEAFDADAIAAHLREEASELAPDAAFHAVFVDKYAPGGTIANRIRSFAREQDATILFVGSENAGRIVSALTVGRTVSGGGSYDTFIVSQERPPAIDALEAELPADELLS